MKAQKAKFRNIILNIDWIEAAKQLPDKSVHCIVTSPPYWGQRLYLFGTENPCDPKKGQHHKWRIEEPYQICENCGGMAPTLGLEKTYQEHIEKLVIGFREMRRILRDDGVMFVNYGDKYATMKGSCNNPGGNSDSIEAKKRDAGALPLHRGNKSDFAGSGIKQGDLIGLAWRLVFALQDDGWIHRGEIIWAKAISSFGQHVCPHCGNELYQAIPQGTDLFGIEIDDEIINHKKSGSTMPEGLNGTRWERCRVKVKNRDKAIGKYGEFNHGLSRQANCPEGALIAQWADCPGCEKCKPNDGLVLKKGSWRCTRAHEYVFQFVKNMGYYCDMEAVKEEAQYGYRQNEPGAYRSVAEQGRRRTLGTTGGPNDNPESGRNLRDVWTINPKAYSEAHYATFPPELIIPMIKVSTSEKGCCPKCGACWARVIEKGEYSKAHQPSKRKGGIDNPHRQSASIQAVGGGYWPTQTLGWRPTCQCGCEETVPCLIYDPFMGSGTVAAEAARLGRDYCGSELNQDYLEEQTKPRIQQAETGLSKQEIANGQETLF